MGWHAWSDGRTDDGEHADELKHGQGVVTRQDGSVYDGEWFMGGAARKGA